MARPLELLYSWTEGSVAPKVLLNMHILTKLWLFFDDESCNDDDLTTTARAQSRTTGEMDRTLTIAQVLMENTRGSKKGSV